MNNTWNRRCEVPGCTHPARSNLARYCESHRQRWRRHGAPTQATIDKNDLNPFVRRARELLKRDTSGQVTAYLVQLHRRMTDYAAGILSDYARGRPMNRYSVHAAKELREVLDNTDPVECALTVAGMLLMLEHDPRRFRTDRGFTFQLVRRFRGQTDTAIVRYSDHRTGASKTVYRDLPVKVVETLGANLREGYARFVMHVVQADRKEMERKRHAETTLDAAFHQLNAAE